MKLVLKKTQNLNKIDIKKICSLKDLHWKFGLTEQLRWFSKNILKNDLHFIICNKTEIIGYTLLRKKNYSYEFMKNKKPTKKLSNYYLFDTHIINPKYRKLGYNQIIMKKISKTITKNKSIAFLVCSKKLINYYKKFGWLLLGKNKVKIVNYNFKSNGMVYNIKKKILNYKKCNFCFYFN